MDNNQSILASLRTVEFRLGLKGYNVDEVDEYLEKAAVEADTLSERVRSVADRLRAANERITQLEAQAVQSPNDIQAVVTDEAAEESLRKTLVLAQRFVDQTRAESEAEAAARIAHAEERARAMIFEAEERAMQVSNEAAARLQAEVARLEEMRHQLAGEVQGMERHLEAERSRLRASLGEVLNWVENGLTSTAGYAASAPATSALTSSPPPPPPQSSSAMPTTTTRQSPAPERRSVPSPPERPAVVNGSRLRSVPPPSSDLFNDSPN